MRTVKKILVYIEGEGGGSGSTQRARRDGEFRQSWKEFLKPLAEHAANRGIRKFTCIPGRGGSTTTDTFGNGLKLQDGAMRMLIIDSEKPVTDVDRPWRELGIAPPEGITDDHCYLMVQCLETWLIADIDRLEEHYNRTKPCFKRNVFPAWPQLEKVDRKRVQSLLEEATDSCGRENRYYHAYGNLLIAKVRRSELQEKLASVHRLFRDFQRAIDIYAEN